MNRHYIHKNLKMIHDEVFQTQCIARRKKRQQFTILKITKHIFEYPIKINFCFTLFMNNQYIVQQDFPSYVDLLI